MLELLQMDTFSPYTDLEGDCPPGFEYTECGAVCQTTCDNYQIYNRICPAVCAPGCICPQQLARYRDRCVDPLECPAVLRSKYNTNYIIYLDLLCMKLTTGIVKKNWLFRKSGTHIHFCIN